MCLCVPVCACVCLCVPVCACVSVVDESACVCVCTRPQTIAGLSYAGDFRMVVGENPRKVHNIVEGNMAGFGALYAPVLQVRGVCIPVCVHCCVCALLCVCIAVCVHCCVCVCAVVFVLLCDCV